MLRMLAGVAALAMVSTPTLADPGNGKGNAKAKNNPAAAAKSDKKANRGQGQGKAHKRHASDAMRGSGKPDHRKGKADRGPTYKASGKAPKPAKSAQRGDDRGLLDRIDDDFIRADYRTSNRGLIQGCPPGLAKKRNGCLPPGQAKKRYRDYRPSLFGLRGLGDGRYYYDDGYLMRYGSGGGIASFIPLLGGALSIGNSWPDYYAPSRLDDHFVDFYSLGGANDYRYADDVIYRVDPETAAITSVAAILTGDEFSVGQPMPHGYDVYNVPPAYREQYYDTSDARYRYADGYVYRVDPETALITAAIDLLT